MNNISSRTEYGIRALVEIASAAPPDAIALRPIKRSAISERQGIPLPFLTQILQSLLSHQLITSARGRFGGYVLARPAQDITVLEVIDALQGPQSPRPCVDSSHDSPCKLATSCQLVPMWAELKKANESVLASYTIADLLEREPCAELNEEANRFAEIVKG